VVSNEAAGDPKFVQIFVYWKCLYIYIYIYIYIYTMLLHDASDMDQRGLKTRHSVQECAFWGSQRCSPKKTSKKEILDS